LTNEVKKCTKFRTSCR